MIEYTYYRLILLISIAFVLQMGCRSEIKTKTQPTPELKKIAPKTKVVEHIADSPQKSKDEGDTKLKENKTQNIENWTELTENDGFVLDIRYATTNNFTKKKIYDCGKCFMRTEAAAKLKVINSALKNKFGYSIKVFDCYRPAPYQQRLWDIVPNPDYVTPPQKGSMHSRGLAIDLTLIDKEGNDLDMGTEFDFFGKEAHQGYPNLSDAAKRHRWILKSTMELHGFASIRTEWWHYSYKNESSSLDQWVWDCH